MTLANDSETWIKCCGDGNNLSFALTSTGKLYRIARYNSASALPVLTQIGTDTTWSDISGRHNSSLGVNNGMFILI